MTSHRLSHDKRFVVIGLPVYGPLTKATFIVNGALTRKTCLHVLQDSLKRVIFLTGFLLLCSISMGRAQPGPLESHGVLTSVIRAIGAEQVPKDLPQTPVANKNYETLWYQLDIEISNAAERPQPKSIFVNVRPHFVDYLTLFYQTNTVWRAQQAGSQLGFIPSISVPGGYIFETAVPASGRLTLYLRAIGTPPLFVFPSVTLPRDPINMGATWQLGLGVQLGALALISLLGWLWFVQARNPMVGWFSLYMTLVVLCTYSGSGLLARDFLAQHPAWDSKIFGLLTIARMAILAFLFRSFFGKENASPWYERCIKLTLALLSLGFIGKIVWPPLPMTGFLVLGFGALPLLQVLALWQSRNLPTKIRHLLLAGFSTILGFFILLITINLLLPDFRELSISINRIGEMLIPLILLYLVFIELKHEKEAYLETQKQLIASRLQTKEAKKSAHERSMLVDMLTHEIRNGLGVVRFVLEAAANPQSGGFDLRRANNAAKTITNLDAILEHCSLTNLLDQNQIQLKLSQTSVDELISTLMNVIDSSGRLVIKGNLESVVTMDSVLTQVALSNLIQNALKYSVVDTPVELHIECASEQVTFSVTNAIDPATAPHADSLFHKYYRNSHTSHLSGSGLGLYIVKSLAELMRGRTEATLEKSTITFWFRIPQ